ncbi:Spc7-domain-containing protein [Xylariaceae sp. FL0594]|nr:Spc7-domain-containing protein [Xylariaceae sp. FL0594]
MPVQMDATVPSTRRPRKSTGHSPVRKRMDKENITVDLASSLAGNASRKKSRSKSIGPGGIDVLKSGTGNRRMSLAAPSKPLPRSILKPTMPIPEIPPHKSKAVTSRRSPPSGTVQGLEKLQNPFLNDESSSGTKVALRTEEEQQAAAREREERERAHLEREINDRREARRKSLANRRVSFAAEATLHTFHEIEYNQDSTTSTDSTRRASSLAAQSTGYGEAADPPSTPPEKTDELVPETPEDHRQRYQGKEHKNSGSSAFDYHNRQEDLTLASSIYSSDSEATEGITEVHEDTGSVSGSESEADGVTMDLDADEMTGTSVASAMSARSIVTNYENDTLDDALELATRRAEAQRIDEEEEIIPSFGWVKKPGRAPLAPARERQGSCGPDDAHNEITSATDMEMTRVIGGVIETEHDIQSVAQEDEISMDVTRALGGIFPSQAQVGGESLVADSRSPLDDSVEDATMELTTAIGGIDKGFHAEDSSDFYDDEDMSMELTTVLGGVVSANKTNGTKRRVSLARRQTLARGDEATMDMTVGLGRILPVDNGDVADGDAGPDATMEMDMTTAVGKIFIRTSPPRSQAQARQIMEQEVDVPDGDEMTKSPSEEHASDITTPGRVSDAENPGTLPLRGKLFRQSNAGSVLGTPLGKSPNGQKGPSPESTDPGYPVLPDTPELSSPVKTPVSVASRSGSPNKGVNGLSNTTPLSATRRSLRLSIFGKDRLTGSMTPQILLTPQKQQLTGIGIDRPGLGSPKVTAILERRSSIGESASPFFPRDDLRAVSFADPELIDDEFEGEERQGVSRMNGYDDGQGGVTNEDEDNNTATLKDMISSMTPKKNPLRGRKSLHVGSASGLLGKRPAELDEDEDEYDRDGIKRLKNHQSSPVKNVRLRAPPSKEETTGRGARLVSKPTENANTNVAAPPVLLVPSQEPNPAPSPPRDIPRFGDIPADQATSTFTFHDMVPLPHPGAGADSDGDRIHLQEFLNLTNIRFMELTTTKRRHTQAPTAQKGMLLEKDDLSLERCVVAGACTVPMLELYQHSCRELKKYISEGRRIVREIELETFEENPPLFKEYMSATPEFKSLMDNQFKNVKTHARLLSKAMWYEWRMKLQDGLKEGLVNISEGMRLDEELLRKEQELLDSIVPQLAQKLDLLVKEHEDLEAAAQELADCDPEDLHFARTELTNLDLTVEAKKRRIKELSEALNETEAAIEQATHAKDSCIADIREAEQVREECRGWTTIEVNSLKDKVDGLERQFGWAITGLTGSNVSMTYQREIQVVFDALSLGSGGDPGGGGVDLWYVAANRDRDPRPLSPEKEFFLGCVRDHVRALARAKTRIHTMLSVIGKAWTLANHVAENVRLLNCTFPTNVTPTSDTSIAVRSSLLLAPLDTKIEITIALNRETSHASSQEDIRISMLHHVRVVYGEHFKVENVEDFLTTHIGTGFPTSEDLHKARSWSDVIGELHERLLARGRK